MNGAAQTTEPSHQPVSDAISKLEDQLSKIRVMTSELQARILGPSPEGLTEATPSPSHVLGRLQQLVGAAQDVGSQLEGLVQQV